MAIQPGLNVARQAELLSGFLLRILVRQCTADNEKLPLLCAFHQLLEQRYERGVNGAGQYEEEKVVQDHQLGPDLQVPEPTPDAPVCHFRYAHYGRAAIQGYGTIPVMC